MAQNPFEDAEVEPPNLIDIFSPEENMQEGQQQLEQLTQQPDCSGKQVQLHNKNINW